ncbi:hypothetical protein VTH8203_01350 [Vibrio thalassae]|uniref:Integrating conjugative element protein, PFL_4695 family n=1 Tax=Vibrio thalassae TaxID=1243014 RepID=A0A240EID5_9VIBR|nr:integrating conjugative element protein [Vibrio thalassae]SNX47735.1 hypothetical protein VTH8203_01350 [Vibrio thalassae]
MKRTTQLTTILLLTIATNAYSDIVRRDTVVTYSHSIGHETAKPSSHDSLPPKKPELTDAELKAVVLEEAKSLNRVLRSSTMTVLNGYKNGKPDLVVLASNEENSQPVGEVVRVDQLEEAEKRKRQMAELAQLERFKKGVVTKEELERSALRSIFPVTTALKPTRLPSRVIKLSPEQAKHVTRPIAVIGADDYSLQWFRMNIGAIRRHNAAVVVTQVNSLTDFQAIKKYAPDIEMQPVDAGLFLQNVGVSVYPIIVTNQGAIQ